MGFFDPSLRIARLVESSREILQMCFRPIEILPLLLLGLDARGMKDFA
jgi:hypothetical protein